MSGAKPILGQLNLVNGDPAAPIAGERDMPSSKIRMESRSG
jgi:hypothetical protein